MLITLHVDLYDLLILTFSDNGKLADLKALQTRAGLSSEEFEDLMQVTCAHSSVSTGSSVNPSYLVYHSGNREFSDFLQLFTNSTDAEQLGEFQNFRLYKDRAPRFLR